MDSSKIGVRYAKALFETALDTNKIDIVYTDFVALAKTYAENPDIEKFFKRPLVKISDKIHFIETLFQAHLDTLTMDFFRLLIRKKREDYLQSIIRNFIDLFRNHKKIKKSQLITAYKVSQDTKRSVEKLLSSHYNDEYTIEMDTIEDASLIGGFVLEIGMVEYDASIKHKLNEIRKTLINASFEAKI
jgi:F-type H+-transporting ATPase subunit delta